MSLCVFINLYVNTHHNCIPWTTLLSLAMNTDSLNFGTDVVLPMKFCILAMCSNYANKIVWLLKTLPICYVKCNGPATFMIVKQRVKQISFKFVLSRAKVYITMPIKCFSIVMSADGEFLSRLAEAIEPARADSWAVELIRGFYL